MSDKQFWAKRGKAVIGPCATREQALQAFNSAHPVKGPAYLLTSRKNDVMTGYGTFGPHFDIQWFQGATK
jgi:hypothetical protein